jgi:hypothetical protein
MAPTQHAILDWIFSAVATSLDYVEAGVSETVAKRKNRREILGYLLQKPDCCIKTDYLLLRLLTISHFLRHKLSNQIIFDMCRIQQV